MGKKDIPVFEIGIIPKKRKSWESKKMSAELENFANGAESGLGSPALLNEDIISGEFQLMTDKPAE